MGPIIQKGSAMLNKKLKICFIGWATSEHVKRWVSWFAARGHEVHLISNVFSEIPGVTVHALQTISPVTGDSSSSDGNKGTNRFWADLKFNYLSYLKYPFYINKTKKILAKIKPDVLQGFYLGFAGYIGVGSGFHPFMVYTGGADLLVFAKQFAFHRWLTKLTLPRIDLLLNPSEESQAAALQLGMSADRTRCLHFGIDLKKFNLTVNASRLREELGLDGHPIILSTRGLYDRYYNISGLLKVFAVVVDKMPQVRLVLKYYSAPEKEKFIALAHQYKIYDRIIWGGQVSYDEMPKYYRMADVYISLSFTDSGPVSLLEAMACGCVPIVSKLKNIAEWVTDKETGFMVDPHDTLTIARIIMDILSNSQKKSAMGEKAFRVIASRADQEKLYGEIERMTYQLVDQQGLRTREGDEKE